MPTRKLSLIPHGLSLRGFLLSLPPGQRRLVVEQLCHDERTAFDLDWPSWAHDGQAAPPGDWRTWVIMAGRGFGKTLAGAKWVTEAVRHGTPLRIALIGGTIDEARKVMVEGQSGLLAVAEPWISQWYPSRHLLRFKGGAEARLYSGASPEALRGPEHHLAWCDELVKWEKAEECWDMLQLGLRLGDAPRALVTTTPRPGPVLKRIMAAPSCMVTAGSTRTNPHLPAAFLDAVEAMYGGTRLGRQELEGELLTDTPGALWSAEVLERARIEWTDLVRPERSAERGVEGRFSASAFGLGSGRTVDGPFAAIAIGVDPPAGQGTCGIVACARDLQGIGHVLGDHSVTGLSPEGWARAVADAAALYGQEASSGRASIVAEKNQGGNMVRHVLHAADPCLTVKLVTAVQGKAVRAEPIALLFETGRVRMHGRFNELEAQLLGLIAGGEYEGPGISPDRADAMVWALTRLMLGKEAGAPRVRGL